MAEAAIDLAGESMSSPNLQEEEFQSFSESNEEESSADEESQKDETELQLEKLVFGDDAGFKDILTREGKIGRVERTGRDDDSDGDATTGLADVADSDLFFIDAGPDTLLRQSHQDSLIKPAEKARLPPAWEDSEDEKMMVSLMSVPRLRKLRHYEEEDLITGHEYTRRLRQQFEYLNPRPKWAQWNVQSKSRKRRASSNEDEDEDSLDDDPSNEEDDISDSEVSTRPLAKLLRSSESLVQSRQILPNKRRKLQPEVISIERMKDIGPTQPSPITCLSVHPHLPLILSSGPSSTLYVHNLLPHPVPPDPPNPLITSLHLKGTPLSTTAFSAPSSQSQESGPKIYMSARRRYFHVWDLPTGSIQKITRIYGHSEEQRTMEVLKPSPCGRYVALKGSSRKGGGIVNILSADTLQWISQVRVESRKGIADFAWWRDGRGMAVVGKGGEVSEWDVEAEEVVARWQDEGAVATTTIALGGEISPNGRGKSSSTANLGTDRWIAIGSTPGIVNIYDRSGWQSTGSSKGETNIMPPPHPKPTKVLENLTTAVSHLSFSPCGQILAMASRWKRDALRLVHLPSCTTYRNWPTAKTPFGRISALTFGEYVEDLHDDNSTRNLVLIVGNEAGTLRGWEVGR